MPRKMPSKMPEPVNEFVANESFVSDTYKETLAEVPHIPNMMDAVSNDDALEKEISKVKYNKMYELLNAEKYNVEVYNPLWTVKTTNEKTVKMRQITSVQSQFETSNFILHGFKAGVMMLEKILCRFVDCRGLANDLLTNPDILKELQILSIERVGIPTFIATEYRLLSIVGMAIAGCVFRNKMIGASSSASSSASPKEDNTSSLREKIRLAKEQASENKSAEKPSGEE